MDGQVGEYDLLNIFFSLVLIALALWIYGRFSGLDRSDTQRGVAKILTVLLLASGLWLGWPTRPAADSGTTQSVRWEEWSPEVVAAHKAEGKTIYVDFTARWCATCQTNKKAVFSSKEVLQEFQQRGIVTLKADWTNKDARITQALAAYGRSAVPFNLIHVPGREEPLILPELLTPGIVLEALRDLPKSP
ncbi:MAG: DUF255 domain-containing protein [Blastochloris sp.]|nr:DUF255 domain-containing protein [Blastochloris sp.]